MQVMRDDKARGKTNNAYYWSFDRRYVFKYNHDPRMRNIEIKCKIDLSRVKNSF